MQVRLKAKRRLRVFLGSPPAPVGEIQLAFTHRYSLPLLGLLGSGGVPARASMLTSIFIVRHSSVEIDSYHGVQRQELQWVIRVREISQIRTLGYISTDQIRIETTQTYFPHVLPCDTL